MRFACEVSTLPPVPDPEPRADPISTARTSGRQFDLATATNSAKVFKNVCKTTACLPWFSTIAGVYSIHAGVYYTKIAEGLAMGLAAALVALLGVSFCILPRFCKATAPEHLPVCCRERVLGIVCTARYMPVIRVSHLRVLTLIGVVKDAC
jgi:hypothetical protein